jgi:hypothetical protein
MGAVKVHVSVLSVPPSSWLTSAPVFVSRLASA